jgi:uncharacterized protein (DUF924 family)
VNERRAQELLEFWFGPDPLAAQNLPARLQLWFGGDAAPEIIAQQDADLVRRFGPLMDAAALGELDHWSASPHRLLALLLLLDQLPRHAFRGRGLAYSRDQKAMALALDGLTSGADAALSLIERLFFYLPLQHAESAEIQEESVTAFRRLAADAPPAHRDFFQDSLEFAEQHRRIVRRFGRFPHRNAPLGRRSTADEQQYLRSGEGL